MGVIFQANYSYISEIFQFGNDFLKKVLSLTELLSSILLTQSQKSVTIGTSSRKMTGSGEITIG